MKISAYGRSDPYLYSFSGPAAAVNSGNDYSAVNPSVEKNQESNRAGTGPARKAGAVECTTCKQRKYQDVSNDAGVSFKAPGHISPEASFSAVKSHEFEHVRNEAAEAAREDRKIVSQSVTLKTDICPECGRVYISGGETRTVTKGEAGNQNKDYFSERYKKIMTKNFGTELDVKV